MRAKTRLPDPDDLDIKRIEEDPQYRALTDELAALDRRLDESEARRKRAIASRRGAKAGRSAIDMAKDLLKGAIVASIDPEAEIAACEREIYEILAPARRAVVAQLEDLRSDLSLSECRRVREHHNAALRRALDAMEEMQRAYGAAASIRAQLLLAGYQPLEQVLPSCLPPAVLALGDNMPFGIAWLRKEMERYGI
jgi:hypothetical protein